MSATNGQAPATDKAAAKAKPQSVARRVAVLEAQVTELAKQNDRITRLLVGLIENQAVTALMPAAEQQLRASIQQKFAQGGLAALIGDQGTAGP